MAQDKPIYEELEEFSTLANRIIKKYPIAFDGIKIEKVCCVKITNKQRPDGKKLWELAAVKPPMNMHNPYLWYVTVWSDDWDALAENTKLALICEIMCGIPKDDTEGKVVPFDTKGYGVMFRTLGTIDYLEDPEIPNILEEDIEWVVDREKDNEPEESGEKLVKENE